MQFLCYVTFSNANSRISIFFRNFERLFTPRTWLGSARNFGKTRFRRFAIFHFSTLNLFLEKFLCKNFWGRFFFQKSEVLEELWIFDPRWQMRRKKLLPEVPLFLGRLPWRRGKWFNMCRRRWLGTENDFNHLKKIDKNGSEKLWKAKKIAKIWFGMPIMINKCNFGGQQTNFGTKMEQKSKVFQFFSNFIFGSAEWRQLISEA